MERGGRIKTGGFQRNENMFGLSYIKPDLSRESVRRAGGGTGLSLRDRDGMGRPVHLWPISTRRAVKAGRVRGAEGRSVLFQLSFSSPPLSTPVSIPSSRGKQGGKFTPGALSTAFGWVSTTSACCPPHHRWGWRRLPCRQ